MSKRKMTAADPILQRFRSALDGVYGGRIERVVLYGSRARGDFRPNSDYDVAVFLNDLSDRWEEMGRIAKIEIDLMDETGAFIHAMPFPAGSYLERTPLMHELRKDGVDL